MVDNLEVIIGNNFEVVTGDVRDYAKLSSVIATFKPDVVIHFAGLKSVSESIKNSSKYYDVNCSGTITLLKAMTRHRIKSLVFSSSATVYSPCSSPPFKEDSELLPINPYGRTKLHCENIIADWVNESVGNGAALLRYFNPIGAHESGLIGDQPVSTPTNIVPILAEVLIGKRDHFPVFGNLYDTRDGTGERDYIHVVDVATAHSLAANLLLSNNGLHFFNIGSGCSTTVLELVQNFESITGKSIKLKICPARSGDIAKSFADVAKAERELKFKSQRDLDDMCRDAWRYYKGFH